MCGTSVPTVSIVIPCYRSSSWLADFVAHLSSVMDEYGESYELLLINDASPDDTWDVICQIASSNPAVRGIDLMFNTGQYRATFCGLEVARGEIIVTMDDDFQHPPEALPELIDALRNDGDCDCVIAAYRAKRHGLMRNLGTSLMSRLFQWLYNKPAKLKMTSFRVMRSDLVAAICKYQTINPNINPLIFHSTTRIKNVDVDHQRRTEGKSGYGFFQLMRLMVDNVFSVSTLPLRFVSIIGFLSAAGSAVLGVMYLVMSLMGKFKVPGFATQVLLTIFFGGMILFSIGLLGEYIIRIMEEVRGKPRYVIRGQAVGESREEDTTDDTGDDPCKQTDAAADTTPEER